MKIEHEKSSQQTYAHIIKKNKGPAKFHWHERYEICQVLNHDCDFLIDSVEIHAKKGDIIAIKEYDIHIFKTLCDDTQYRIVQFSPKLIVNPSQSSRLLKTHITREEIESVPSLGDKLNTLFEWMEEECKKGNPDANELLKLHTRTLYELLAQNFGVASARVRSDREDFYRIVEYVNTHYTENINVTDIAEKLFIYRGRLSATFYKYAGVPLTEYIDTVRVEHANELLRNGASVAVASYESGFCSIRTFNAAYKRIMKITPTQYKKDV